MKPRLFILTIVLALVPSGPTARAQIPAKTADIIQEVNPDGSVNLTFQFAFDAQPWGVWKSQVGEDPARLRGMFRHQFAAYVIDDFKFEKDDLNRTAKMTIRSPAGPELGKDQRFQIPVEAWCRLINNTGRTWFFSGNNPFSGDQQTTVKIVVPANTIDASLVNAGTPDQALVYAVSEPAGKSRLFVWSGVIVMLLGAVLLAAGRLSKKGPAPSTAAAPPTG
ncbi:MAG TPA: hypothetical protein VLW52_02075 [Opitutaceae bacterium]|nr:hypothetical protein [Opitutaceae bacterium]